MAIGPGLPGATMEAFSEGFDCGLVGTVGVTIDDGDGNNVLPRTTANIVEIECVGGIAVYRYLGVYPSDPALSPYVITWDDTTNLATEEILVSTEEPVVPSEVGPCQPWIDAEEVVGCCSGVDLDSDNAAALQQAAEDASALLYELSGARFSGLCGPITARPCGDNCGCWPGQRLDYVAAGGDRWLWGGTSWGNGISICGCGCVSQILLSGYPVQGISQVKIDGEVVSPSDYRLDQKRYLTRKNGERWPVCQDLSLDDDQPGTFSVSYWYGATPPRLAQLAAASLACELFKLCDPDFTGECLIPAGATRITRQGVTVDKTATLIWFFGQGDNAGWKTGMGTVDAFLSAYAPYGQRRRPMTWSPDARRYAKIVG